LRSKLAGKGDRSRLVDVGDQLATRNLVYSA
jgi:hypothetical protein